jgi:hypothetical protein
MTPGPGCGTGPPAGDSGTQAVFQEEPDRLLLSNQSLSMAFSRLGAGAIASLSQPRTGLELIDAAEAVAEGSLWQINLVSQTGARATITSRSCEHFSHAASAGDSGSVRLRLEWSGLRVGAARIEGRVAAAFTFPAAGEAVAAELEFDLPEGMSVASVEFPRLTALGVADPAVEEALFLPLSDGVLIPEPRPLLAHQNGKRWRVHYPGPASLQLFGYCCGARATLWLASRDASGARKALVAAAMPNSNHLALWLEHYPRPGGSGHWALGYAVALGLAAGDWHEAARAYRAWALLQPWCGRGRNGVERRPPALTSLQGMWLSHWGDAESAVTAVRELLRQVNAPARLDWHDWHQAPPPDYFPPRDGDQGFADAVRELAESGVYVQLALDGRHAHRGSQAWQEHGALLSAGGDPPGDLVAACPGTEQWQTQMASVAARGTARGIEGIYLAGLGAGGDAGCTNQAHGHDSADPAHWARGVRRVFAEVRRAVGDSYQLATDGPAEPYLDVLDAFFVAHAAAERAGLFPDDLGQRWQPIPLFTAVYHEYCAQIAFGPSLTNGRLQSASPSQLSARDYPAQFCLEIARAMVWGRQLALRDFAPEQAREERHRRTLAFLAAALRAQTWGVGAFLPYAEFLGALAVTAPAIEVEVLANAWSARGEEVRLMRRRVSPVLGAAWRVPGGLALVMGNIHEHPVEFGADLRACRLVPGAPLRLIGRTFSEDGDAPAATLRTSGSDVAGRLPARCFILITVQ